MKTENIGKHAVVTYDGHMLPCVIIGSYTSMGFNCYVVELSGNLIVNRSIGTLPRYEEDASDFDHGNHLTVNENFLEII